MQKNRNTLKTKLVPQCNFNRGGSAWSHFCVYMSPTNPTAIGTNTNAARRYEQMQYKQTNKKHISNVVIGTEPPSCFWDGLATNPEIHTSKSRIDIKLKSVILYVYCLADKVSVKPKYI